MAEIYRDSWPHVVTYLVENLGFTEEDAEYALDDLVEYEEGSHKRITRCSGWIHDTTKDVYYLITYDSDYDWGSSNYVLYTSPKKLVVEEVVVKKTKFVDVE